jgi:DNA repair exonuclease SbcCD ATPase subunit
VSDLNKEYLQKKRQERIERSLPKPLGEKVIAATANVRREMTDISLRLALVQAALRMSMDGRTRATVTEVVDRAKEEVDNIWILPSTAGQAFSVLGFRRVNVHGERRLVLDFGQLRKIHDGLVRQFEKIKPRVEEAAERFDRLTEQVKGLEDRMDLIYSNARQEKFLREFILKHEQTPRTTANLERQYQLLKAQAQRRDQLEAACKQYEGKLDDLKPLEERWKKLKSAVDRHEAERQKLRSQEMELTENEKRLGSRLGEYKQRLRTVEIAELDEEVKRRRTELDDETKTRRKELDEELRGRREELDQVLKQLGEKKTLLTRMFGKQREGEPR